MSTNAQSSPFAGVNRVELHSFDEANPQDLSAYLYTTESALTQFRHMGFLAGDTFTAQLVKKLGQSRREHYIEQRADLNGNFTMPTTQTAVGSECIFEEVQTLLDKLGQLEKFLYVPQTAENREKFKAAHREYLSALAVRLDASPGSEHHQVMVQALKAMSEHQSEFSAEGMLGVSFDLSGPDSLAEKIRGEATRLLSCLNSYHFLYLKEQGHLPGFAHNCIKDALIDATQHEFSLSTRAKFKRDLLPDRSNASREDKPVVIALEGYVEDLTAKSLEHLQRFSNYLNKGQQPNTLERLTLGRFVLKQFKLFRLRHSGVDHPANKVSGLRFVGRLLLRGVAWVLDNLFGLFTGLFKINCYFFRKKVTEFQFSNKPDTPEALREWRIRREWIPGPTLLNELVQVGVKLVIQVVSAALYGISAIWDGLKTLATDHYLAQRVRGLFEAPEDEEKGDLKNFGEDPG